MIVVQRIELCKTLLQNLIQVSSGRGTDEVEDFRSYVLRKAGYCMVELPLGYSDGFDGKLRIHQLAQTMLQLRRARKLGASKQRSQLRELMEEEKDLHQLLQQVPEFHRFLACWMKKFTSAG